MRQGELMSAFLVSQKTVNRIVSFVDSCSYGDSLLSCAIQRAVKDFGIDRILNNNSEKGLTALSNCLLYLNKRAVDTRYRETNQLNLMKFGYENFSNMQALKSMHCFLYQCSEGSQFENSRIYRFIERIAHLLERHIIMNLPEYEVCEWGWFLSHFIFLWSI
jgi:hypothetical protein